MEKHLVREFCQGIGFDLKGISPVDMTHTVVEKDNQKIYFAQSGTMIAIEENGKLTYTIEGITNLRMYAIKLLNLQIERRYKK